MYTLLTEIHSSHFLSIHFLFQNLIQVATLHIIIMSPQVPVGVGSFLDLAYFEVLECFEEYWSDQYFVECPDLACIWCFHRKIEDMRYWKENQNQRARVPFSSHHIKDTYSLCDLALLILVWWPGWDGICEVLCKFLPPMPFTDCTLGKSLCTAYT